MNGSFILHSGTSNVGVVLVHEIFGLDEYIDSVGGQLSQEGYWVAVVDLFRGKHASSLEEGFKLRAALKESDIVECASIGSGFVAGQNWWKSEGWLDGFLYGWRRRTAGSMQSRACILRRLLRHD